MIMVWTEQGQSIANSKNINDHPEFIALLFQITIFGLNKIGRHNGQISIIFRKKQNFPKNHGLIIGCIKVASVKLL